MSTPLPPSGPRLASVTVGTYELRQALRAVVAHCSKDKNAPERYTRVHWVLDPIKQHLYVNATNGFTSGLADTSVVEDHLGVVDRRSWSTSKGTATEILSMFPSADDGGPDGITDVLQLDIHEEYLVVTDTSGLLVGKQARWHLSHATDDAVDPLHLYRVLLSVHRSGRYRLPTRTLAGGKFVALFSEASVAYNQPLCLEHSAGESNKPVILVSCGDSFLGAISPITPTDEARSEMESHRVGWERRLGVDFSVEFIPGTEVPEESSEQPAGAR